MSQIRDMKPPIKEGEAFGAYVIRRVQAGIGRDSIFAGDEGRVRQIRKDFDEVVGDLVRWTLSQP